MEYFSSVIPSSDGFDATKLSFLAPQTLRGFQGFPVKSGGGDLFMSLGEGCPGLSLSQENKLPGVFDHLRERRLVSVFLIKIKQGKDLEISYSFIDNG